MFKGPPESPPRVPKLLFLTPIVQMWKSLRNFEVLIGCSENETLLLDSLHRTEPPPAILIRHDGDGDLHQRVGEAAAPVHGGAPARGHRLPAGEGFVVTGPGVGGQTHGPHLLTKQQLCNGLK